MKKNWLLLCVFVVLRFDYNLAQPQHDIDSLLNELKTSVSDTAKVHVLNQLGIKWLSATDKTNSIQYFKEALSLAEIISFGKGKAKAYHELGSLYGRQSNYALALENLNAALKTCQEINDTGCIASEYIAIGITYKVMGNYPEALQNQLNALEIFKKINEKKGMAIVYNNIGIIYKNQGNYPEALKYYKQSFSLVQEFGDKPSIANYHTNIGNLYRLQGDYPEALKHQLAVLKIQEESGDKGGIAMSYVNIGSIYGDQNNNIEALQYHQAALKIMVEMENKRGIAESYHNIGNIYKIQGNHSLALENFQQALKIWEEMNDKRGIARVQYSCGALYATQGHFDEAMNCYLISMKIAEEIGSKDLLSYGYSGIGHLLLRQGRITENRIAATEKFTEAVDSFKKGLSIAAESGARERVSSFYEALSEAYKLLNNYPLSLDYLSRHNALKDSISNDDNNRKLEKLRTQYEIEKAIMAEKVKQDSLLNEQRLIAERERAIMSARNLYHQQEIAMLAKEKDLQKWQLEKNEADLFAQQMLTQKKESDLVAQKAEAEKGQEQLAVLNKERVISELQLKKERLTKNFFIGGLCLFLVLSFFIYKNYQSRQEVKLLTLRNKIASDLHDDVGSTLSSISMFSQMAQSQSKDVIPALETIGESSRKMLDAMADIVWTIKPENDQFDKVIMRMREFAFDLLGTKQIDFEFDTDEDISKFNLSMEARKNLYLIFKEATNNMAKYSEAKRAKFALNGEKDRLTMVISDNGKGFDTNIASRGNGLTNMKKRAEEMGAQLLIMSTPGFGTSIKIELAV